MIGETRDDLFIFEATGETDAANELLQSRDHYRTRKMGIVYTLFITACGLAYRVFRLCAVIGTSIVPYRTDALRYYMHDFYLYGAKLLPAAGICLLLAAAIVFIRFLRRHASETNKRRKDPSARWQAPRWAGDLHRGLVDSLFAHRCHRCTAQYLQYLYR